ncbi:homocysteine S-methyltransferase family protein, partial [Mesorhizobium sp. M4B.F.Ca.ET.017.02.2.1]|uniref:homocysteine S-methyltransferase family protein n=1 Tax=Mesorhizobium sp. M4B.F.Ca.ET.017.02.2.1 TaxID=2496649 RepID=UPI000FD2F7E0
FLCEPMASADEARAAVTAAAESGKPVWVSWTLADHGTPRLRSGETIAAASRALGDLPVVARLVNCCRPEAVSAALPDLIALGGPVGAYANGFTSIEALKHGGTVDVLHARHDLDPRAYADQAIGWVEAGALIVGGCREVGPTPIAALRDRLDEAGHRISGVQ